MNEVFKPHLRKFILVFFYDILVYSLDLPTHFTHLESIFKLLQQHKLYVDNKKCELGKNQLAYLGHVISAQGVAVDPAKAQVILDWPCPKSLIEIRGFLGLSGYYRRFV